LVFEQNLYVYQFLWHVVTAMLLWHMAYNNMP